ncbi:MAG: SDR family oxidoreductase [Nitrospirae bacterium]|nr:SDR family oxidoreductase [Nitrospirota bacterium]MBF0553598.1 SDR family oxidoreductase [Nitrospirota bacterium]
MGKFDLIKLGEKAEIKHVITEDDIKKFVELTGDDNKIHVDAEYAKNTTFKKPVVHGMLSASFISTIIGTKLPGDGALWFAYNVEFLLPVRVGDELHVAAEVINKVERLGIIELKTEIHNQFKQKVLKGTAKVKIVEDEVPDNVLTEQSTRKTALVIGATGGIGTAACLQLAKDGFDIGVHYNINEGKARELRHEIEKTGQKAMIFKADIRNENQVMDMAEHVIRIFGKLDVLVNCSTIRIANIAFSHMQWQDMQNHIDINVKGFFNLMKSFLPYMEKEKTGKVINIITQDVDKPKSQIAHYITAKSALSGFSKALVSELATNGILINMVSPGMTDTELIGDIPEKIKLLVKAGTPLKRIAKPEDVSGAISFLASNMSDFLTGETIRVNGGQVMI